MFSRVTNFFAEAFSPRPSTSTPNLIVPPPSNQLQQNNNQNSNTQTTGRRSFINLVSPITHRRNVENNNNHQEQDTNAMTSNNKKRSASFKTQFDRLFGEDDGNSQKKEEQQERIHDNNNNNNVIVINSTPRIQQQQQHRNASSSAKKSGNKNHESSSSSAIKKQLETAQHRNMELQKEVENLKTENQKLMLLDRKQEEGGTRTNRRRRDHHEQEDSTIYHLYYINSGNIKLIDNKDGPPPSSITQEPKKRGRNPKPKPEDLERMQQEKEAKKNRAPSLKKLDEGGLGSVYLAEYFVPLPRREKASIKNNNNNNNNNNKWSRPVVLKVFHSYDNGSKEVELFINLMNKYASSTRHGHIHPNIVGCYGYTTTEKEQIGLVLERADGNLHQFLLKHGKHRPLTLDKRQLYKLALDIARGLEFLHTPDESKGKGIIVHLDLKPENVLVFSNEDNTTTTTLKLTDFGSVKISDVVDNRFRAGSPLMTTEEYAPPEQHMPPCSPSPSPRRINNNKIGAAASPSRQEVIRFLKTVGPSWDVYSFGRILGNLISHSNLSVSKTNKDPMLDPTELKKLGYQCCRKEPENRIQNGGELVRILLEMRKRELGE